MPSESISMQTHELPLDRLEAHPHNSNVMPNSAFARLKQHLDATGQYPPIVARPHPHVDERGAMYQILDGHHRAQALRELGHATAWGLIWEVDDDQALMLLATLNRLEGKDDPHKRAALLEALQQRQTPATLAQHLPESAAQLKRMVAANHAPPTPRPPQAPAAMPEAMHFFFTPSVRRRVEAALHAIDADRQQALLKALHIDPTA